METKKEFSATGNVLGITWMGYSAGMKANSNVLKGESVKEILSNAKKALKNGALGTGDFQTLRGAWINIQIKTTIVYEGIEFYRYDDESKFIGVLTHEEKTFLTTSEF